MSVQPARYNLKAWRGATFTKQLTVLQSDSNSAPRDLTDYTASLEVINPTTEAELLSLTTENGGITIDGASGIISLLVSAEDTADLTFQAGVYELLITSSDEVTDAILFGNFSVTGI